MRITKTQIAELEKLITQKGLSLDQFEFTKTDDTIAYKFKEDYFFYVITKKAEDDYLSTFANIRSKTEHTARDGWKAVTNRFVIWANEIASELAVELEYEKRTKKIIPQIDISELSEMIKKVSPRFKIVFHQARQAEEMGLDEICGLGFRKAFEILIKDYLIKKNPKTETTAIKKMPVVQCVNKYVSDDKIKVLCHRVIWLGNDQAHYLREHKTKTVKDLKDLIFLTISWIENHEEWQRIQKQVSKIEKQITHKNSKAKA